MSMAIAQPAHLSVVHEVLSRRLAEVVEPKFDRQEFRLSESGKCGRYRVAKVLGLIDEEHDEQDAGYYERGHLIERWVVDQFRAVYPRRCRTQQTVRTPYGDTGHIDIWFPSERRIIEVKSVSDREQELPRKDHVLQVQAYMHYLRDPRGERRCDVAEIVYVKYGRELSYEVFVAEYDPETAKRIDDELRRLHEYADRYQLPDIPAGYEPAVAPCTTFYGGEPRRCPMWDKCWVGNPQGPALDAPEVEDWVRQYAQLKQERDGVRREMQALEDAMSDIQVKLAALMDIHETHKVEAGGFVVNRTIVKPNPRFDADAAVKDGAIPPEVIERYQRESKSYERWTVKKAKEAI